MFKFPFKGMMRNSVKGILVSLQKFGKIVQHSFSPFRFRLIKHLNIVKDIVNKVRLNLRLGNTYQRMFKLDSVFKKISVDNIIKHKKLNADLNRSCNGNRIDFLYVFVTGLNLQCINKYA